MHFGRSLKFFFRANNILILCIFFFAATGASGSDPRGGASGGGANNAVNKYDKLVAAPDENAEHETSPKPIIRSGKEKRPNKMHHANKGKQQRDRRKLREKRRSTGKPPQKILLNRIFILH